MENVIPYNWSPGYRRGRIIDNSLAENAAIFYTPIWVTMK